MQDMYITIVGFSNYYGKEPFKIGTVFVCEKEPDNAFDNEAIKVTYPVLGTVGYIANGVTTKANGTLTAGRIYDQVGDKFAVEVCFTTNSKVIAQVERAGVQEDLDLAEPISSENNTDSISESVNF